MNDERSTKVLIFGDYDAALSVSYLHQLLVNGPLLKFADCQDIMPGEAQGSHNGKIAILIREKSHARASWNSS